MRMKIFLLYFARFSFSFIFEYFLFPYDDDVENCVVGWKVIVQFLSHFRRKKRRCRGVRGEWQCHFRQLKHFFPQRFLFSIARMVFIVLSPILLFSFHFQASMKTIFAFFFTAFLFKGEKRWNKKQHNV